MEDGSRKRGRDQSEINLKWWSKKRRVFVANEVLQGERDRLLQVVETVKDEMNAMRAEYATSRRKSRMMIMEERREHRCKVDELNKTIEALERRIELKSAAHASTLSDLQEAIESNAEERASMASILKPLECFGGLKKIKDRQNLLTAVGGVIFGFMSVLMYKTMPITRLRVICEVLFKKCIFGVEATKDMLSELYKQFYYKEQRNVFAPWKVLRAIDLSSVGGLNYNGLETLRNVEVLERYQRGVLPSRSSVQKASYELHDIGQGVIPFHRKECHIGEMYQYDYERFLRFILKIFQLEEVAQRESVELSITLDGAELCDGISHLTAGIKVTDPRAINPRDGSPLCMTTDEIMGRMFQNQSRNNCFALKSLIGKDCKKAYKEFADFFKFFEQVKKYGLNASELGPRIMPMEIWSPQDLSSIWKCLNTGGGARKNGKTHFCHLCACCGDNIVRFLVGDNRYFFIFSICLSFCFFGLVFIFNAFFFMFLDVIFVRNMSMSTAITGTSGMSRLWRSLNEN